LLGLLSSLSLLGLLGLLSSLGASLIGGADMVLSVTAFFGFMRGRG
jgi:hypothetical protein